MYDVFGRTSATKANSLMLLLSHPCSYRVGFLPHTAFRHKAGLSIVPISTVGSGTMTLSSTLSFVLVPECSTELIASRGRG